MSFYFLSVLKRFSSSSSSHFLKMCISKKDSVYIRGTEKNDKQASSPCYHVFEAFGVWELVCFLCKTKIRRAVEESEKVLEKFLFQLVSFSGALATFNAVMFPDSKAAATAGGATSS